MTPLCMTCSRVMVQRAIRASAQRLPNSPALPLLLALLFWEFLLPKQANAMNVSASGKLQAVCALSRNSSMRAGRETLHSV